MRHFNKGLLLSLSAVLLISCGIGGNHESDFESLGVGPDNSTGTSGKSKGEEVILDYDNPGEVDEATFDSAFTKFFASNASFMIDRTYNASYANKDGNGGHHVSNTSIDFVAKIDFVNNIVYGMISDKSAANTGYAYYGNHAIYACATSGSYQYEIQTKNANHETLAQAMQNGTFLSATSGSSWRFAFPSVYNNFTYDVQTSFYYTKYNQGGEASFGVQISKGRIVRVFYETASGYYKLTNVGITELYVPSAAKDADGIMGAWGDDYPTITSSRN